jgi:hypothetical protein
MIPVEFKRRGHIELSRRPQVGDPLVVESLHPVVYLR